MNNCTINIDLKNLEKIKKGFLQGVKIQRRDLLPQLFSLLKIFEEQDQKEIIAQLEQDPDLILYKEQLEKEKEIINNIWKKEFPQKPTIQGIDKEYLDLRLDTPSQLSTLLKPKEISSFLKEVQREILSKTFFDGETIIDEDTIHQAIINYQREQLRILNPGVNSTFTNFTWNISDEHYQQNYRNIIEQTIGLLQRNPNSTELYSLKKALLILTNLDSLIEHFHPFIKVVKNKGKVRSTKGKYVFVSGQLGKGDYNNEEKNTSIDRITTAKLKSIIETIPRDDDTYVSMDFFHEFVREQSIQNVEDFFEKLNNFEQTKTKSKNKKSYKAFADYLLAYKTAYDKKLAAASIINKGKVHQNFNLIDLIQNYIESSDNKYYLEVSQEKVKVKTKLDYNDSKFLWRNAIMKKIKTAFNNGTFWMAAYKSLTIDGVALNQIKNNDLELLAYLSQLTDISLRPSQVEEYFAAHPYIIGTFLTSLQNLVKEHKLSIYSDKDAFNAFEEDLVRNDEYVAFTDILAQIDAHNKSTLMSQDGRELAGMSIHTTMGNFLKDKQKLKKDLQYSNILYQSTDPTYIATISSIQNGSDSTKYYKPTDLNVTELAVLEIAKLYFNKDIQLQNNKINTAIAHFQIDAYSDKTSIFVGSYDISSLLQINKEEDLIKMLHKQHQGYYRNIINKILSDFSSLGFTVQGESITDQYLNLFEQLQNLKQADLEQLILDKNINLVQDFHYCLDKKGYIRPNPRLFYQLQLAKDIEFFSSELSESFSKFYEKIYNKDFEIDYDTVPNFWKLEGIENSKEAFLKKYFLIRNLVRDAYLQITIQPSFFHDNKGDVLTSAQLKLAFNNISDLQNQTPIIPTNPKWNWSRFSSNNYELSSQGDTRFSALYATFKAGTTIFGHDVSGRTIESVYQHGIKQGDWVTNNNSKTGAPKSKEIIKGNTEDASYAEGYLPLWQEWAKQNPELIEELREKSKGKVLTDKFANTRVSQARAFADILNENVENTIIQSFQPTSIQKTITIDPIFLHKKNSKDSKQQSEEKWINDKNYIDGLIQNEIKEVLKAGVSSLDLQISNIDLLKAEKGFEEHVVYLQNEIKKCQNPFNTIKENISQTAIAAKKRGNFAGASYSTLLTGKQYTIPKTIKMALIDEPKETIDTYYATQAENQSLHDGAISTPAIVQVWETRSQLNVTPKGTTRKYIFLENNLGYGVQIKCADNVISNQLVRNGNPHLKLLLKKAYRVASLEKFNENLKSFYTDKNRVQDIIFDNIYRNINGHLCKLTKLEADENGIKLNWVDSSTGTSISVREANTLFDSEKVDEYGYWHLENLYDLWQAFGGEHCQSYKDGEMVYSELNNEVIADLISFLNAQDVKENVISKLVNPSAVKSSKTNQNSKERVEDESKDLLTFTFDASKYGLQQDYAHESNESESPFPTQVSSSLAFNGENIEACDRIYEAVGWLIRNNLSKLPNFTNLQETNKWLGKKLLTAFQNVQNVTTNGELIVKNFLLELSETLPVSDPNIYYKITSQILSDLNNSTLRQKLPGAGLIQCPSKNIIQIYEDNTGKKYTRTQLFKKYNTTDLQQLNYFIKEDTQFKPKEVHISDLNIQDTVLFNGILTKITSPSELYEIYDVIGDDGLITKVYTEPRDLATSKITWEAEGKKYNYWLLPTTRAMFKARDQYGLNSQEYHNTILADRQVRKLIKNKQMLINDKIVPITNYKYKPGEQIAPKIYKNRMGLGNTALSDIDVEFFKDKVTNDYFPSAPVLFDNKQIYCVCQASNDFESAPIAKEFYFGDFSEENFQHNVYIDKDNNVYTQDNEFLFTLPFENNNEIKINAIFDASTGKIIIKVQETDKDKIEDYLNEFDSDNSIFYSTHMSDVNYRNKLFKPIDWVKNTNVQTISNLAEKLYNSFVLSNITLSLRIPTQAFQSFMVSETVAFLESDENLVYNNIWEMIFQGSDFDIDKAYTVMYAVDNNGLIKGNVFTNYNNTENIIKSLQLPLPNYKAIEYSVTEDTFTEIISNVLNKYDINFEDLYQHANYYDVISDLITILNNGKDFVIKINSPFIQLVEDLNKYTGYKTIKKKGIRVLKKIKTSNDYIKNIIVQGMLDVSADISNLRASSELMETRPMTQHIKKNKQIVNEYDPSFIWLTQVQNAIGKTDVGIAANGLKVASTLQQFYNKKFQEGGIKEYDLNIPINLHYDGKKINKTIHHIANLKLSDENIYELYGDDVDVQSIRNEIENTENTAFNLSVLLSLAVDNAKELALASMYGMPDLLKFHVALATLGFSAEEIVKLSTKYLGLISNKLEETNRLSSKSFYKPDITSIINGLAITEQEKDSLLAIFKFANNMTNLAQLLKINQGVSPDYYSFSDFTQKFTKGLNLSSQETIQFMQLPKDSQLAKLAEMKITQEKNIDTINQLEIIAEHPLFNGLAKAVFTNKNFLNNISAKTIILDTIKEQNDKIDVKKVIKIIDDYVIGETLKKINIALPKKQLEEIYGAELSNILEGGALYLNNNVGLQEFINIMNNNIIPSLQKYYGDDNYFFSILRENEKGFYSLPFSSFSSEQHPSHKQNLTLAKNSFEEISHLTSYLNINGVELTLGDLFQLYQLVTNKNSFGNGLKYCVESSKGNLKLYETISQVYTELDKEAFETKFNNSELIGRIKELAEGLSTNGYSLDDSGVELIANTGPILTYNQPFHIGDATTIKETIEKYFNNNIEIDILNDESTSIGVTGPKEFTLSLSKNIKSLNSLDIISVLSLIQNSLKTDKNDIFNEYQGVIDTVEISEDIQRLINDLHLDDIKFYIANTTDINANTLPRYFKTSEEQICIVNQVISPEALYKTYFKRATDSNNHTIWLLHAVRTALKDKHIRVDFSNYQEIINLYEEELRNNELFKNAYNILTQDADFFKSKAHKAITNHQLQLSNPDIFYVESSLSNPYEGCILTTRTGKLNYICVGKNADGDLIGVSLVNVDNIETLKASDVVIKEPLQIKQTLKENLGEYKPIEDKLNYTIKIGDKIDNKQIIYITYDSNNNTYYLVQNKNIIERIPLSAINESTNIETFKSNVILDYKFKVNDKKCGLPKMYIEGKGVIKEKIIDGEEVTYILTTGDKVKASSDLQLKYNAELFQELDPAFSKINDIDWVDIDISNNYAFKKYVKNSNLIELKDIKIGDIFKINNQFYKKLDEFTYLTSFNNNLNLVSQGSIFGEIQEHYSQDILPININSTVNISETINKFLNKFVELTGVPVQIEQAEKEGVSALVNTNGITIYIPTNLDTEEKIMDFIAKEATHEYLHVLMGFLRNSNPDAYFDLLKGIKEDAINVLDSEIYNGDFQKREEVYIRQITKLITENLDKDPLCKFNSLLINLNNALSPIFGSKFDITTPLFNNLVNSKFAVRDIINFKTMKERTISTKVFDKITKEC